MPKSKDISHFVSAKISELRPNEAIPTNLYFYFFQNRRMLLWKPSGTTFSPEDLKTFKQDGLENFWIHTDEWDLFENFLHAPNQFIPPQTSENAYQTKISAPTILKIIRGQGPIHEKIPGERGALVALAARSLIAELASPNDLAQQKIVNGAISSTIKEIVTGKVANTRSLAGQIWQISTSVSAPFRAINVATYSVLFAMAFGYFDEDVLCDMSLAALIQRVGLTQLPISAVQKTSNELGKSEAEMLRNQAALTLHLVEQFAPDFIQRARKLIPLPDEPKNEFAQIIAMAAALESWCSGNEDGIEKTVTEGLWFLEVTACTAPNRFNTDRLATIMGWIREANSVATAA